MIAAARYVDAQLAPEARAEFELRLVREPLLASAVRATQELRAPFSFERQQDPPRLRPDFAARVLEASRRLTTAAERGVIVPDAGATHGGSFSFARRLLVAAALILGLGLLMFAGLLRRADSGRLEAAPVQQKKLDELDAKIRATLRPADTGSGRPR